MMTKDNLWVSFPQYKSGEDYKDYVYTDKDLNEDLDNLASVIEKAVKWTYNSDEDFMHLPVDEELPF